MSSLISDGIPLDNLWFIYLHSNQKRIYVIPNYRFPTDLFWKNGLLPFVVGYGDPFNLMSEIDEKNYVYCTRKDINANYILLRKNRIYGKLFIDYYENNCDVIGCIEAI